MAARVYVMLCKYKLHRPAQYAWVLVTTYIKDVWLSKPDMEPYWFWKAVRWYVLFGLHSNVFWQRAMTFLCQIVIVIRILTVLISHTTWQTSAIYYLRCYWLATQYTLNIISLPIKMSTACPYLTCITFSLLFVEHRYNRRDIAF